MENTPELTSYLETFLTERRKERMLRVLDQRTDYLTICLENLYQPHNASAVLRSCDCFGIQDVHIIENENKFTDNREISLGTSQWLDLHNYNRTDSNTVDALTAIKAKGYRIVATTPHTDDVMLEDLDVEKGPLCLVFGTELTGISDTVRDLADEYMRIPMYGFAESFNISVSAALCLHHLSYKIRSGNLDWALDQDRKEEIYGRWVRGSVKNADRIIEDYLARR